MKYFIKENDWLFKGLPDSYRIISTGWGNGYVAIPPGHFLHGKNYNEIDDIICIDVHGGLTFSAHYDDCKTWKEVTEEYEDYWIIGFDTAHLNDNSIQHNKEYVLAETLKLRNQIKNFEPVTLEKKI